MAKVNRSDREQQLNDQLRLQRRKVDFDTYDVPIRELLTQLIGDEIDVAPAYQRQYRWDDVRASQLIESLLLGIPIPSLFMATNDDSSWEIVDGLQRLTAVTKFCSDTDGLEKVKQNENLKLDGLKKLTEFNGLYFSDLPSDMQKAFLKRAFKVVTLSDKSDKIVRFDLFERLNRGGIELSKQEIRHCVFRGEFADFLEEMGKNEDFNKVLILKENQKKDATKEECVLRFFAYLNDRSSFVHLVDEFLTGYMETANKSFDFKTNSALFRKTFSQLSKVFPDGLRRQGKKTGVTSLVLFEAVAVGAALAINETDNLVVGKEWLGHPTLQKWTTGATNNVPALNGRIEFCRDRFLGIPLENE